LPRPIRNAETRWGNPMTAIVANRAASNAAAFLHVFLQRTETRFRRLFDCCATRIWAVASLALVAVWLPAIAGAPL